MVLLLWIIYIFLSCVCYAFVCVCLFVPCGHLLGKGWPLGSRLWYLNVSLSLSHWYPGSGVTVDCIDSWPLHPYLLSLICLSQLCLLSLTLVSHLSFSRFCFLTSYDILCNVMFGFAVSIWFNNTNFLSVSFWVSNIKTLTSNASICLCSHFLYRIP